MFALSRLAEGLVIAHIFLLVSFLVGSGVFSVPTARTQSAAHAMLRTVCTCAAGMAILGFVMFVLAVIGLFSAPFVISATAVLLLLGSVLGKRGISNSEYWSGRVRSLIESWDLPTLLVYGVMLVLAVPSVIPNLGGDPINYHLAFAGDLAHSAKLVVDPFLRFPFYANNYTLLFAALLSLHGAAFVNFLTWVAALLTGLGVYASVRTALDGNRIRLWPAVVSGALMLAVILSPTFLRWLNTAYLDVPIGTFALSPVLCMQLALLERDRRWLFVAAVIAAFFIGMKPSFLVLFPVFALAIFLTARGMQVPRKIAWLCLLLYLILSAPWYIRNLILAGDPVPPVVNIALYGTDGIVTKSEWNALQSDLATTRTGRALFILPFRAFVEPGSRDFREYGVNALMLLLYVPMLVLIVRLGLGARGDPILPISVVLLTAFVLYWFFTGTLLRYALLFFPLLAACLGFSAAAITINMPAYWRSYLAPIIGLIAIASIIPSPGTKEFYRRIYHSGYKDLASAYTGDQAYLMHFGEGYAEEEYASSTLARAGIRGRVYGLGKSDPYFFQRHGFVSIGDWVGPAGYFRLAHAVDAGQAPRYLADLGVDAVLIDPPPPLRGLAVPLERQLTAHGFCAVQVPGTQSRLLLRYSRDCKSSRSFAARSPALTRNSCWVLPENCTSYIRALSRS